MPEMQGAGVKVNLQYLQRDYSPVAEWRCVHHKTEAKRKNGKYHKRSKKFLGGQSWLEH